MSKKVNMFDATRELSARVAEYMKVAVYNAVLKTRYKAEIEACDEKIENAPRLLAGSIMEEQLPTLLEGYKAEREAIVEKYEKLRADADRFTLLDCDKEFYKTYKTGNVKDAIITWGKVWGLDLTDTDFYGVIAVSVMGVRRANAKTIITSGATVFTADRTRTDVLGTMYAIFAEKMLAVGTLKPEQLPEDVVAYYKSKKSNQSSK